MLYVVYAKGQILAARQPVRLRGSTVAVFLERMTEGAIALTRHEAAKPLLVACADMDGTLLDSSSRILPSSATAIRAALKSGVRVVLATGKKQSINWLQGLVCVG